MGIFSGSISIPTGSYLPFAASTPPAGFLKCDGSAISRALYPELFAVIGTTYGAGDGSTTFNLPNFINRTFWGAATSGAIKVAGLPNITGSINGPAGTSATGAITTNPLVGLSSGPSTSIREGGTYFNANLSNPIYGASSTVQPPALTTIICIKY